MRIPKRVNIFGHNVKIKVVHKIPCKGENYAGLAHLLEDGITLAMKDKFGRALSQDYRNEVFLHELLHHVNDKCGTKLPEKTIRKFSMGVYQLLKDNKLKFF